jgi:hypothetical protein
VVEGLAAWGIYKVYLLILERWSSFAPDIVWYAEMGLATFS